MKVNLHTRTLGLMLKWNHLGKPAPVTLKTQESALQVESAILFSCVPRFIGFNEEF